MTVNPRSAEDIHSAIRVQLRATIDKMTNFVEGSFNDMFVQSYSEQIRQAELKALAAELGGYVEYAGRDLTQDDLDALNITDVDPPDINQYMNDEQLDRLAANENIERNSGVPSNGDVTFEVSDDSVEVEDGFTVGTEPDSNGEYLSFEVSIRGDRDESADDEDPYVTPATGETEVDVQVMATEPGPSHNVPAGVVTHIANPEPGIHSVENDGIISGGEPAQTNQSLRDDIRNSTFNSSGGGTRGGLETYVDENTANNVDVETEEHTDVCPSYVDVVVDGGERSNLEELVSESRPIGIRHNVVRPTNISIGVSSDVVGIGVDGDAPQSEIVNFIDALEMGDNFSWSSLLSQTMNSDSNIDTVPSLNTFVTAVERERFEYDSTNTAYTLEYAPLGYVNGVEYHYSTTTDEYPLQFVDVDPESVVVEASVDGLDDVLERGSAYTIEQFDPDDSDVDSYEAIVIQDDPGIDDGSTISVEYQHSDISIEAVETIDGDPLLEGTHFDIVDSSGDGQYDSVDLHSAESRVNDGELLEITYRPGSQFDGDLTVDNRQKLLPDPSNIAIDIHTH